ncbi:HypC/HybG/HupF family hydrogenase formation chaperone [candidate division GN15 bacterium]|nr:HypC/HybG/HupF family hydrogenase formation chaperone [candidate division GN15 bacterium]
MCLAVPGRIISIENEGELTRCGRVDFEGVTRDINLSCVPEASVGDYVLVHAGVAIGKVHEDEAERTLALLRGLSVSESKGDNEAS